MTNGGRRMNKSHQLQKDGISLKTLHIAMIICAVVICLLLVFSTYESASVFSSLSKATGSYIVRQKAAHELMEASDYLTEMTQRFTLEGDTQFLDNYFEEAFVSRRREESITSMSEGETESDLMNQLQEAMDELRLRVDPLTFQAFELYGMQDRPASEVAETLELSRDQLYVAKSRCLKILREIVARENQFDGDLRLEI